MSDLPDNIELPKQSRIASLWDDYAGCFVWLGAIALFFLVNTLFCGKSSLPTLEDSATGGYSNIVTGAYLYLRENKTCTLSSDEKMSHGTWSATDQIVAINIDGPAGALHGEYDFTGDGEITVLAPSPANEAKVKDSFYSYSPEEEPPDPY